MGTTDQRILSLIASATEIVCALGHRQQLVGRSHECDFPPDVRRLPQATTPRFDVNASSGDIDAQVKALAAASPALDALGVYTVHEEMLRDLRPTHIVTQTHCEVCAVSRRDVEAAVARVTGYEPRIVDLQPNTLADIWEDFQRVASALGSTQAGTRLVASLQERMAAIAAETRGLPATPTVAALEWIDPLLAAGNWIPELIRMAGGRCLFGRVGEHAPWLSYEEFQAADPDVILLVLCGFDIARTRKDVPILAALPGWSSLRAVRSGRVYIADGNQYFNRPGPRLAESLEILAEMLYPSLFSFGHQGVAWQPLTARIS